MRQLPQQKKTEYTLSKLARLQIEQEREQATWLRQRKNKVAKPEQIKNGEANLTVRTAQEKGWCSYLDCS
jgi:hypothetical protein